MADVSSSSNQAGSWTPPHGGEEDDLVESEDEELVEDEEDEDETHEEEDKPRNTFDIRRTDVQNGADLQGIPWRQLSINRRTYRNTRTHDYPSFRNLDIPLKTLKPELTPTSSARYYDFLYNFRKRVRCSYGHFQLRNLVWATSNHDVWYMNHHSIHHMFTPSQKVTRFVDLRGGKFHIGRVQISSMAVREGLCVVGGFHGELHVTNIESHSIRYNGKMSKEENSITNNVDIIRSYSGDRVLSVANNDCIVRLLDLNTMDVVQRRPFPWCVNAVAVSPDHKVMAVVGDDENVCLVDNGSGTPIGTLRGHIDYSFCVQWHPTQERLLATGNQDHSVRVWDTRYSSKALAVLPGRMCSIRNVLFSPCGSFMTAAEGADFVRIYDVGKGFKACQELEFFGEVSGVSFSPDSTRLFVGIADVAYGGLLEMTLTKNSMLERVFL